MAVAVLQELAQVFIHYSVLQPLDLGIIKNFKVHYRKLLLCHILSKIEECNTASEVVQSVTILNAVMRWHQKML